ncbi:hypothetical protein L486_06946 [Kwoniella mangroviensis CBS 10435]|uniref:Uncharacterized protein n=1 Tax=Kwoniella mangroviensis CBS 10435 TaxID=1331196 RepID=A0A1B9IIV6_9TREE|nr:hypothetical protein L486_06946 [Kwoniella mangroviensis CBS 10435]
MIFISSRRNKRNGVNLFVLSLLAYLTTINALSEYQALEVVKGFADSYLAPKNIEVARSINSTLFAEDVTGTADLSTNFDGRELSTEYLFGLFVNTAEDQNDPSPFGSPISYNVTALLVQHNFISTSIKFQFHYPILNETFPIQIDAFMQVNENSEIQQYDVSFRRWAWATDNIIPKLIPFMQKGLNLTNITDTSVILRTYLSEKICQMAMDHCTGPYEQYKDTEECMTFLNGKEIGEWYRMGEDNLVCRHLHVPMLPLRPSVHCPHIGPSGGDMCIARDYKQVVMDSHFPQGWLAPKYVTPENQDEIGGIYAVSGEDLDPLLEIALSPGDSHSWDPTLYATALLGYFLIFYVVSNILWFIYFRRSSVFPTLGLEHQKNVVMYTMNIIFTTIALALELVAAPAFAQRYALWEVQCLRTAGVLVSALYIFELIYKLKMRIPMIAHHFLSIIAISFTVTVFEYTQSMSYLISAVIWLFQATTEQPTFFGLLGYRLDWDRRTVSRILKIAAVQTFIFKSASAIGLVVYWEVHQNYSYRPMDKAWNSMVFILAIGLMLTQIWGSWVTYQIAIRIIKQPILLGNPKFKGSNLAIYQTIRLKSEDDGQNHKRSDSSGSGTALDDDIDRYEIMTTDESTPLPSGGSLNRLPSLSSLDGTGRNRLMSNADYIRVRDKVNNEQYPHSGGGGGLMVGLDPANIPLPRSPSLLSPASCSARSHDQYLSTTPNPTDRARDEGGKSGIRNSASFGRAL